MPPLSRRALLLIGVTSGLAATFMSRRKQAPVQEPAQAPEAPPEAAQPAPPPRTPPAQVNGVTLHGMPLVAQALSPDGALLATGAEADPAFADEPVEGVVLWDVETAAPLRRVDVPGGVGLADQLRGGLRFSPAGDLLAINGHTNGVFTARVGTGERLADHYVTGNDGPPQFVWSEDGQELFIGDGGEGAIGGLLPGQRTIPQEQIAWLSAHACERRDLVRLEAEGLLVVEDGALLRYPRGGGAPVLVRRVLATAHSFAARFGDLLLVTGDRVAVVDLRADRVLLTLEGVGRVQGAVRAGEHFLLVSESPGRRASRASLLSLDGTLSALPPSLCPVEWLSFPDALPAALSPDGAQALLLGEDLSVQIWELGPEPRMLRALGSWAGACGVLWPQAARGIVLGPSRLVFLSLPEGAALAEHLFPDGKGGPSHP